MIHELKIKSEYLLAVQDGSKTFEIRKNDRNYKVGDWLHLRGYHNGQHTGLETVKQISYMFEGNDQYGLKKGFVVLGLRT